MRGRVGGAIGTAALIALLVLPGASAFGATKRGEIVVEKEITLLMPTPGVYKGDVFFGDIRVKKVAVAGAHKAPARQRNRARLKALDFCIEDAVETHVQVHHLSDPPFLIGTDKPRNLKYRVTGPEPPTNDPVRARQPGAGGTLSTRRWKWNVSCPTATKTRPYPF